MFEWINVAYVGGGIVLSIVSKLAYDGSKWGKNPNGHCSKHAELVESNLKLTSSLDQLADAHRDEKQVELLTKALAEALKANGK